MKPTVLVATTDRWYPTVRLAMALANAGCKVEAVCPSRHPVAKTRAVPRPYLYRGLAPLKSFTEAIAATKPDFILPGDDLATRHLHELHHRERQKGKAGAALCELIERSLGAPESFPIVYARTSFMEVARREGIRVPETQIIATISDLRDWIGRTDFPAVLKADGSSGGYGVRIVNTTKEAVRAFGKLQAPPLLARAAKRALVDQDKTLIWPSLLRRRSVVNAQTFVAGREATSTIVCWEGAVLAALHFEVLSKRDSAGPATVVRLIENSEMAAAAEKIARRLNLSGIHGLDFMLQAQTGDAYLIEMNPRATQVGHLTLGPGRDLPAALYSALSGEPVREAVRVTENDTIVLFPHEWKRNPDSAFLQTGYHDVPWEEPELVRNCLPVSASSKSLYLNAPQRHSIAQQSNSPISTNARRPSASLSGFMSEQGSQDRAALTNRTMRKPLRVMKFGGTSVGDASSIEKVVEIIRKSVRDSNPVVVVSAMSGVTNKLIDAATKAEAGNWSEVATIFDGLREQHERVIRRLIHSAAERDRITGKMAEFLAEGDRLCQGTGLLRELTPRVRDKISSLGERLSAPIVAAVLVERGVASEAIEATELIVTDSCHGSADPRMDLTRERCQTRLSPLLKQGVIPVVTGFIGSTPDGLLTTLGRGGSDFSATILGATLQADEVEIWTDVDGLMTADPRLVPEARTIPTISYQEAAELACFGARVLHPKALSPVMERNIPLSIRNTFAPDREGTKITPSALPKADGVKALTATKDVALITIGGPGMVGVTDVVGRAFATIAAVRADVLLISQSSSRNDICLVISMAGATRTVEALRREFAHDLVPEDAEHIRVDSSVAIVTVVGQNLRGSSEITGRAFGALSRRNVGIIAVAQGSSDCNISFVVAKEDMNETVVAVHEEFQLGTLSTEVLPLRKPSQPSADWCYEPGRASAD
jgi:aspartokinase/homoserine dehydrogenase 1